MREGLQLEDVTPTPVQRDRWQFMAKFVNFFKASAARRRHGLGLSGLGIVLLAASCVPHGANRVASASDAATELAEAPPPPEPLLLKPVAPAEAIAINASIPLSVLPNPRAPSVVFRARTPTDQLRSLDCLAQAVYYEARSESEDGQRAVAQVVLNRLRHPTYPGTVCGVVYQGSERSTGCQFTFTCDGSLAIPAGGPGWARARRIAAEALAGKVYGPVGHATHYHTVAVLPYWAPSLVKSAVIGAHIFYRWSGAWGQPAAFRQRYAGYEPGLAAAAQQAALAAPLPSPALPLKLADIIRPSSEAEAADPLATLVTAPPDKLPKVKLTELGLPQSNVREQYRNSGAIKARPSAVAAAPDHPDPNEL
jgi:spore germination cell wall hydrolase CwlJ-like protein